MKRVITYGTFDLFHEGHVRILRRAKALGDYLVVAISSDEFNQLKGKKSVMSYEQRKEVVEAIRYVDLVIPEHDWEQKIHDVQKYDIDVFVMGDDWTGKFDFLKDYCEVVYLPRTENISTTMIKEKLNKKIQILFFGTDGQLYYLSQGVTTKVITFKPFRAYIRLPKGAINWSDGQQARVRHRAFGEETDIEDTESTFLESEIIYDLMGRKVTTMEKGKMYIVNGKKVIR